jgi:hypothetical protein
MSEQFRSCWQDRQPITERPETITAGLPVPEGSSREMVALGYRIYQGQVGGASCTGCHGAKGTGSPLGPDLTKKTWLWSDGSFAGIEGDYGWRSATQTISQSDAADGWGTTCPIPRSALPGAESLEDKARGLGAEPLVPAGKCFQEFRRPAFDRRLVGR